MDVCYGLCKNVKDCSVVVKRYIVIKCEEVVKIRWYKIFLKEIIMILMINEYLLMFFIYVRNVYINIFNKDVWGLIISN